MNSSARRLLPLALLAPAAGLVLLLVLLVRTPVVGPDDREPRDAAGGAATASAPEPRPEVDERASAARIQATESSPAPVPASATRTYAVRGTTFDRLRQPLPRALVRVVSWRAVAGESEPWTELEGLPPATAASSDRAGRFTLALVLAGVPANGAIQLRFEVTLELHEPRTLLARTNEAGEADLGELVLPGLGTVCGHVRDRNGATSAHATIEIARRDAEASDEELRFRTFAESGEEGEFAVAGVREGNFALRARFPDLRQGMEREFHLRAGEERFDVELVVPEAADWSSLSGTVLGPDGQPLAHAEVVARARGSRGGQAASSDEQGRFRLPLTARPGSLFDVTVVDGPRACAAVKQLGVALGTHELVFRLAPGPRIRVHASRPDGRAPERLDWRFLDLERRLFLARQDARAAADGEFDLPVPDQDFFLFLECPGELPLELGPFAASAPHERVEARFGPGAGLRGRVVAAGEAVADASVTLSRVATSDTAMPTPGTPAKQESVPVQSRVLVDREGRFALALPPAGTWRLAAESRNRGAGETLPFEVDAVAPTAFEIELRPFAALEGRVTREDGTPASRCFVLATHAGDEARTLRTEQDGSFRFERLPVGDYSVRASTADPRLQRGRSRPTSATPSEECVLVPGATTRVDLVLPKPAFVRIRVGLEPAPPGGWTASLSCPTTPGSDNTGAWVRGIGPDADGRFLFETSYAGTARLNLNGEADGWRLHLIRSIVIEPDGPEIEFNPTRGQLVLQSKQDPPQGSLFHLTWPAADGYSSARMIRAGLGRSSCPFAFAGECIVERTPASDPPARRVQLRVGETLVLDDF